MDASVKKTVIPTVAGILNIVVGVIILSILFLFATAPIVFPVISDPLVSLEFSFNTLFLIAPGLIVGLLAITGGIFAIYRKRWGWALAGSIAAALNPLPFGLIAIVLLLISRNEFYSTSHQTSS